MIYSRIKKSLILCIVLTLFVFSLLILSCKKKIPTFYVSQVSKDYCVYKSGSYWIYRNDSTGSLVRISTYQDPSSDIVSRGGYQEECIYVYLQGGFLTDTYIAHQCSSDHSINYNEGDDRIYLGIQDPDGSQGLTFSIWSAQSLNIDQADPCHCPYDNCYYFKTEILNSYSYGGKIFNNVLHTTYRSADTTEANPDAFTFHFYFVKHIGLIRMFEKELNTHVHRSFGLIGWNVSQ